MTIIYSRNSLYCYAIEITRDSFFGNSHDQNHFIGFPSLSRVEKLWSSFIHIFTFIIRRENQLRASRAFHWRGKGPKSSFSIVYLWISSIRSSYILVILVHFHLFFIFVIMLMFPFSFCLILVNSSIVFFLTSLHTAVMTSRAQLGM
jgi:hypothetical protein